VTIRRLKIGTGLICESVPAELWNLGHDPMEWVVVFTDRKPKGMRGVYEFMRSAKAGFDSILIVNRPDNDLLRAHTNFIDGSFYMLAAGREELWADGAVPEHGYVWAEYAG
jgi:hypothetical protein